MIRIMALCVFRRGQSILVSTGFDSVKKSRFARPLGGGVEFWEHSSDALIREIREELGQEIRDLRLLGVLESVFTYEGKPGHQIVFVYDAQFVDESLYTRAEIPMAEAGWSTPAIWYSLDSITSQDILVPEGLMNLLCNATP